MSEDCSITTTYPEISTGIPKFRFSKYMLQKFYSHDIRYKIATLVNLGSNPALIVPKDPAYHLLFYHPDLNAHPFFVC